MAILRSQGLIKKKGTAADIVRMLGGAKGVRVRKGDRGPNPG